MLSELFEKCLTAQYVHTEQGGDYAFLWEDGTLYLLFQWSNGCEDWKNNLDFPAASYREMGRRFYCHRGFLRVWQAILPHIEPTLRTVRPQRLVLVGYSHGAALAVLAHEYIWFHRPDLRERLWGYGFGCPRCLWGRLPRDIAGRWERFLPVRNGRDLVTHLPPAILLYRHPQKPLQVGQGGRLSPIDAHRPENYRSALARYDAGKIYKKQKDVLDKKRKI